MRLKKTVASLGAALVVLANSGNLAQADTNKSFASEHSLAAVSKNIDWQIVKQALPILIKPASVSTNAKPTTPQHDIDNLTKQEQDANNWVFANGSEVYAQFKFASPQTLESIEFEQLDHAAVGIELIGKNSKHKLGLLAVQEGKVRFSKPYSDISAVKITFPAREAQPYSSSLKALKFFAAGQSALEKQLQGVFADKQLAKLKAKVSAKDIAALPEPFKSLAEKLQKNTDLGLLLAEYSAGTNPLEVKEKLQLFGTFSSHENITGVYLAPGKHVVMVGDTQGQKISLRLPDYLRALPKGEDAFKHWGKWSLQSPEITLQSGLNVIEVKYPTNAYISYFAKEPANSPKIAVHFVTGEQNGFFDTGKKHTNADWDRMLAAAKGPIFDARGKHIHMAFPVDALKKYTAGKGCELLDVYDRILDAELEIGGLKKYGKVPDNRVFARVNYWYYMFRDSESICFIGEDGTLQNVLDPARISKGDPCWGFSHESGHIMQTFPITWTGMIEVSVNIFSMHATTKLGNPSRLKEEQRYAKAREQIIDKKISYLECEDQLARLVPFWQLHLYFSRHTDNKDFYPDLLEHLRCNAVKYPENQSLRYQLQFVKSACEVSKTDLSEFFEKYGFFKSGNLEISDTHGMRRSKEFIDEKWVQELRDWIKQQNYPKPVTDITLLED